MFSFDKKQKTGTRKKNVLKVLKQISVQIFGNVVMELNLYVFSSVYTHAD